MSWIKKVNKGYDQYSTGTNTVYKELENNDLTEVNSSQDNNLHNSGLFYTVEEESGDDLPSGVYKLTTSDYTHVLVPIDVTRSETILDLSICDDVTNDFKHFLKSKKIYKKLNLFYKRGILLFGPPGTGKTSAITKIINENRPKNSLVIFTSDTLPLSFRQILKDDNRLKIIIFEEITNLLGGDDSAPESLLTFLDGETSFDNCFIIATTNYPERLPANLAQRFGRFDKLYKIDKLKKEHVIKYLSHFNIEVTDINKEIFNKTITELKEIVLLCLRDNLSINEALTFVQEHINLARKNFNTKDSIGF